MGYPLQLALRYLGAKKRTFVSVGTAFAILGVTLGVAALAIVMSVTGGFQEQFREKVLGVNAHVLVLKYSIDFREYRDIMAKAATAKGVIGVAPFIINPMMVTHANRTATGVLLKGVDPVAMQQVLDLPKHITEPEIPKTASDAERAALVAKTLGRMLGVTRTRDPVDAHVVLLARERGWPVVSSGCRSLVSASTR